MSFSRRAQASRPRSLKLSGFLLLVGVGLLAGGCSTVSNFYDNLFGDSSQKPAELIALPAPGAGLRVLWQGGTGPSRNYIFSPAVDQENVYAAGSDGQLVRFDARSGRPAWQIQAARRLSGGVGAGDNLVLVSTPKGEVLAFDAQGARRWITPLLSEVLGAPQVAGGIVIVRSADGRLYGLDAASGQRKWLHQRTTPALTVRTHAPAVVSQGVVYSGFPGGKLGALELETGNLGWEATVSQPRGTTELERVTDITSAPLVDSNQVCAAAFQGRVGCFDTRTGNLLWARDISSIAGLAADEQNVYVVDDKSAVIALDKTSGRSLWKQDKMFARRVTAPLVHGAYLALGDYQGYVHLLKREDGSFAARIATDGSAISARPVALADGFVVQTRKGGLFALTVQ